MIIVARTMPSVWNSERAWRSQRAYQGEAGAIGPEAPEGVKRVGSGAAVESVEVVKSAKSGHGVRIAIKVDERGGRGTVCHDGGLGGGDGGRRCGGEAERNEGGRRGVVVV